MDRPLTARETRYLESHKAVLDTAWQALWLAGLLLALPVGFLGSALLGHAGGWSTERWASVGSGLILLLLIGAVVGFSPRESRRMGLAEIRRRFALGHDLSEGLAAEESLTIDAKDARRGGPAAPDGSVPRSYFIQAGGREFQISGVHWMGLAPGSEVIVSYAPRSRVVLAIDGDADRLALPEPTRRDDATQTPFGDY